MAAYRSLTADKRNQLNRLVEIIESFLPLSTYRKTANSFENIFKESGVHKYLGSKKLPKKKRLYKGFSKVYQQHQKIPYTILRKVLQQGELYRRSDYVRNPIKPEEIEEIRDCLKKLGLNLDDELAVLELNPDLPEIQVPPKDLVERLESHHLVEEIRSDPLQKFKDGHFNEAVRKACEKYEVKVQRLSGNSSIGSSLMGQVFNPQSPAITIATKSEQNIATIRDGYQKLAMGMMSGIRNIFSHGDEDRRKPEEAYEMLLFVNWMFRKLNTDPN
ncbi:TIGR02391 family protein [Pleurocapsales cyanobacterium LEGE 10410]|nr:TIGR02391 family protein [Pleurocapsales cyanobacterium LEGE 10410]